MYFQILIELFQFYWNSKTHQNRGIKLDLVPLKRLWLVSHVSQRTCHSPGQKTDKPNPTFLQTHFNPAIPGRVFLTHVFLTHVFSVRETDLNTLFRALIWALIRPNIQFFQILDNYSLPSFVSPIFRPSKTRHYWRWSVTKTILKWKFIHWMGCPNGLLKLIVASSL